MSYVALSVLADTPFVLDAAGPIPYQTIPRLAYRTVPIPCPIVPNHVIIIIESRLVPSRLIFLDFEYSGIGGSGLAQHRQP